MNAKFKSIVLVSILVLAGFVMVWNFSPKNVNVNAAALYVGGGGPGNYTTIQDAINASSNGDTVYVYSGFYNENITIDKSIDIVGNGTLNTTINATGSETVINVTADWVNITGIKIINSGSSELNFDAGIKLNNVKYNKIEDCNISNNLYGIYIVDSDNCTLKNNEVYNTTHTGIHIETSDDCTLIDNNVSFSNQGINQWQYAGVHFDNSNENTIENNLMHNNPYYGLRFSNSHSNLIFINDIIFNCGDEAGILIEWSDYNEILNNNISNNTDVGIYITVSFHTNIFNNTLIGNVGPGMQIWSSDYTEVINNTVINNGGDGIYVSDCDNSDIMDNDIINSSSYGLFVRGDDCNIINNNVSEGVDHGIYLFLSSNCDIQDNEVHLNENAGIYIDNSNHINITDNNVTSNNKGTTPWNNAGMYIRDNSHNNTLINNYITNNSYYGVRILNSVDNSIILNEIVHNCGGESGIYLQNADSNEFINNNVSNNTGNGFTIEDSDSNVFINNTIDGNNEFIVANGGIGFWNSHNNWWDNNSIKNNGGVGIYMSASYGNMFTNCTINGSTVEDARSSNSNFILLNCTFDKNKFAQTGSGTITVQYYHTLFTYDWATVNEDAGGVGAATLWINNSGDPTHIYDRLTNANGYIYWVNLTAYIYDGTFNYSMQDMQFHATKTGYSEGINITNASAANFLIKIYMVDPFEPMLYDVSMVPDENITKTNPTLVKAKIEEDNLLFVGMMFMHNSGQSATEEYYDIVAYIFENDPRITLQAGPGNLTYFNGTFDGTSNGGWADDGVNRTWVPFMYTPDPTVMGFNCIYKNDSNPTGTPAFAMFYAGNGTFRGLHFDNGENLDPYQMGNNDIIEYTTMRFVFDINTGNMVNMYSDFVISGFNALGTSVEWYNKTPSGRYKMLLMASDRSDNSGGYLGSLTVDNTGPDNIVISATPLYVTNTTKGMVTLEATTTSIDGQNATFYTSPDGVNWQFLYFDDDGGDGWKYTFDSTLSPDQEVYFKVIMNDTWGNVNESKPFYLIIDNTPPDIMITDPALPDLVLNGSISLVATTVADDVEWCRFEYKIGAQDWTLLYLDDNGTDGWSYLMDSTAFDDGNYTIRATMGDRANNTNVSLITLVVDNTAPNITLITPYSGSYISKDTELRVNVDEINMDFVEFSNADGSTVWPLYYIDSDGSDGWSMNISINEPEPGHYILLIFAQDLAGNNATTLWEVNIDTQAPDVSFNFPNDGDYLAGTVTINTTASDTSSGIDYAVIIYDDGISTAEIYNSTPSADTFETVWDTTSYDDGDATLTLISMDIAGLMSLTSITVTLDNTAPLADAGDDVNIDAGTELEFNGNGSSDNLGILSYEWNFTYDGANQTLTGLTSTFTFDIVGDFEVTLTVTDMAGNAATDTMTVHVISAVELPIVDNTDPQDGATDVPITSAVVITFSLAMDNSTVEAALDISPTVGYTVSWNGDYTVLTIDFTTDLELFTTYTVTIGTDAMATNGGLLQNTPFAISFTTGLPNTRPILTLGTISPTSGDIDTMFTFSVHYYDADGDPPDSITVVIDGVEHDMTLADGDADDGTYEYKAKLAEGPHTYYFTANDGTNDAVSGDTTPTTTADAAGTPTISKAEDKEAGFEDWMLYLILIIVVIIIIVILLFAMSRRKPAEEELLADEEEELAADTELEGMEDKGLDEKAAEDKSEKESESAEDEGGFECPTCGASLAKGDTVCPECGEQFDDED